MFGYLSLYVLRYNSSSFLNFFILFYFIFRWWSCWILTFECGLMLCIIVFVLCHNIMSVFVFAYIYRANNREWSRGNLLLSPPITCKTSNIERWSWIIILFFFCIRYLDLLLISLGQWLNFTCFFFILKHHILALVPFTQIK